MYRHQHFLLNVMTKVGRHECHDTQKQTHTGHSNKWCYVTTLWAEVNDVEHNGCSKVSEAQSNHYSYKHLAKIIKPKLS